MAKKKRLREPQQSRSIRMKEKILETALKLFCKKGFYRTTTNEIAQTAGVSIGSLYAYFKDRDTIFFEILDRYHKKFVTLHGESINKLSADQMDRKEWLRELVEGLVSIHERSREFNRELKVLYYSNAKVAAIMDRQNEETLQMITGYLHFWKNRIDAEDLAVTAAVAFDFISAIIDRIAFGGKTVNREHTLQMGVDALFSFFML